MSHKMIIPIRGMHCKSCELLIEEEVKKVERVIAVSVDHKSGKAEIQYHGSQPLHNTSLERAVGAAGYSIGDPERLPFISRKVSDYKRLVLGALLIGILYWFARATGLTELTVNTNNGGFAVAGLVGLIAGVSTCMALVGGLVLGFSARHAELHPEATPAQKFRPHIFFNLGRIIGYAALGGVVGLIGGVLRPSIGMIGLLTVVVGAVMIFLGAKLIGIFPALENKTLALPKSIARFFGFKKDQKEYSHKGTFLAGALTFFLPCGFTQAMQIYAISTGSFWSGALIMGLFALGTAPGLLGLGGLTSVFKGSRAKFIFTAAGIAVFLFGSYNIANGARLLGGLNVRSVPGSQAEQNSGVQEIRMEQNNRGYSPQVLTVTKGIPVKWIINSTAPFSCASSIVMPKYRIQKTLSKGENIIIFTPQEAGEIPFSCAMGMYRGKFIVTNSVDDALPSDSAEVLREFPLQNQAQPSATAGFGGGCGAGGGGCGGCGGNRVPSLPVVGNTEVAGQDQTQIIKTTYTLANDIQPNTFTVEAGKPVDFQIDVQDNGQGCMSTIVIPGLYNTPQYLERGPLSLKFTPLKSGNYQITCAMGVPRGQIIVK